MLRLSPKVLHTEPFAGERCDQAFKDKIAHSLTMSDAVNIMSVAKPWLMTCMSVNKPCH